MTRSVRWVRAFATSFCSATTVERLIVPILVDLEVERREMIESGRLWLARWVVFRGYVGLCTALALHGAHAFCRSLQPDGASKRTLECFAAAFVVLTFLLVLPPLLNARGFTHARLVVFSLPQAIPLVFPIALACGIVGGWSRDAGARAMLRRVLVLGIAGTALSLAALEWLVPAANQGFRVAVSRRLVEANQPFRSRLLAASATDRCPSSWRSSHGRGPVAGSPMRTGPMQRSRISYEACLAAGL